MKTDLYTKSVLTVIAAALVILTIQNTNLVHEAHAGKTNFNSFATVPVNNDGSISVKLMSDQMDVNIKSINGSSIYGALPINIKEINGSSFYGTIPINLKELNGTNVGSTGLPINIEAVNGYDIYSAVPVKEAK